MEGIRRLLALPHPPTAVFCYDDMTAIGALRQVRKFGLRVPDDISLVGFDDLPIVRYTDPPLTTVHQPMPQMGRWPWRRCSISWQDRIPRTTSRCRVN